MQDTRPLIHTFWESLWQHLGSLIYSDPPPENHRLTIHPFGQLFYWLFVTNIITTSIHNSSLEIIVPTSQVASNTEYTYFYNHTTCSSKTDECVKYIKHAEGATVDLNYHWEGNSTYQSNILPNWSQCRSVYSNPWSFLCLPADSSKPPWRVFLSALAWIVYGARWWNLHRVLESQFRHVSSVFIPFCSLLSVAITLIGQHIRDILSDSARSRLVLNILLIATQPNRLENQFKGSFWYVWVTV